MRISPRQPVTQRPTHPPTEQLNGGAGEYCSKLH
jgi:hypothetical protein